MELFPCLYSYAHLSRLTGTNILRQIPGQLYEFMFGNEMLVAPVFEKGATFRTVYLPDGNWINYWTGDQLAGNKKYKICSPIDQIPLFIRSGSVIPMREYCSSIEKGTNDSIFLDVYPGDTSSFTMIEDNGIKNEYQQGIYASTEIYRKNLKNGFSVTINPVRGTFEGMNDYRSWILRIKGQKGLLKAKSRNIKLNVSYDSDKQEVIIRTGQLDKTRICKIFISTSPIIASPVTN
jgi:alpha-glucosidase (family GH31 glycosyl hydrolase)